MKFVFLLAIGFILFRTVRSLFASGGGGTRISATEAAAQVRAGQALLIDVREPAEWESGVAAPAYLLPLSDLRGARKKWQHVLDDTGGKILILYCRSGNRSGQAAALLAKEGFTVANAGGFRDWQAVKLPVRGPEDPAGND
jgi:rhodanese-related sulfurtransferase